MKLIITWSSISLQHIRQIAITSSQYLIPSLLCCLLTLESCNEKSANNPAKMPVNTVVFSDTAFWQDYHQGYPIKGTEGANEVRSITTTNNGNVWIATAAGVFKKKMDNTPWEPVLDPGPAFSVETEHGTTVWISNWKGLYRYSEKGMEKLDGPELPVASLCIAKEGVYALGPHGSWLYSNSSWVKKDFNIARSIRDVKSDGRTGLWVATDVGLYHASDSATEHLVDTSQLISAYIRGVAIDHAGHVWAGGLGGVSILNDDKKIKTLRPANGIPSYEVRSMEYSPDMTMWIGTDMGVVRYKSDFSHSLRFGKRWLLNNKVNDISFDEDSNAWLATDGGVSVIRKKKMTLASKEAYFYDVLMRRHIREPWIAGQCRLPIAGDTTIWKPEDDDNDGEYTSNYLAMESFRYAVTKSDDARKKAGKAFKFLKLLQEVTDTDGFFARTIVPSSWTFVHDGNRIYTEQEKADELIKEPRFKPVEVRWRKSKDGKWLWKGDTSSDEICGHMFGYFLYHELVADDVEKQIIATHISKIVDHLIKNNYTLTDIDGSPTRWGVWSPDRLNRDPEWSPDQSLNSMELLSFLKLAYHVTKNEKYQSEYMRLIKDEKYLENMARIPRQNPAWFIYFDVMLAAYQYPILLKCEKDPEILEFYKQHIETWIDMRKDDQNPLINFIYAYSTGNKVELSRSIEFLTDTPLDLVDWTFDHTARADITVVHRPVLDELQVSTLQPPSIRATVRWDKNPWSISPGNPHVEREPVFWLLPYWMGKYLDMIH